jgi:hypothetical protein
MSINSNNPTNVDLETHAWHEAGHVAMAFLQDIPITKATLNEDEIKKEGAKKDVKGLVKSADKFQDKIDNILSRIQKDDKDVVLGFPSLTEEEKDLLKKDILFTLAGGISEWKQKNPSAIALPDYDGQNGANIIYQCDNVKTQEIEGTGSYSDWQLAFDEISCLNGNFVESRFSLYSYAVNEIWPLLNDHWKLVKLIVKAFIGSSTHTLNESELDHIWNNYQKHLKN